MRGGAAHLPGMIAAKTTVPVLGVPVIQGATCRGGSLHSIVQMPAGRARGPRLPLAPQAPPTPPCLPALLGQRRPELRQRLEAFRAEQTEAARQATLAAERTSASILVPLDPGTGSTLAYWGRPAGPHVCAPAQAHGLLHRRAGPRRHQPAGLVSHHHIPTAVRPPGPG